MLIKAKSLKGYTLKSLDGDIGSASEFLFDDRHWAVRYLVANTGGWLSGRKVLLSPYSLNNIDTSTEKLYVHLTKKQVEDSPSIATDEPVSQQYETNFNGYYGYPNYWGGPFLWGGYPTLMLDRAQWSLPTSEEMNWDRHLRSTTEVTGYDLRARDGEIGHVDDFILDVETWSIRYVVVATKNWWPGKSCFRRSGSKACVGTIEKFQLDYLATTSRPPRNTPTFLYSREITKPGFMGTTTGKDIGSTNAKLRKLPFNRLSDWFSQALHA